MRLKLVQLMPEEAELLLCVDVVQLLLGEAQMLLGAAQETPTIELKLKLGSARLQLQLQAIMSPRPSRALTRSSCAVQGTTMPSTCWIVSPAGSEITWGG